MRTLVVLCLGTTLLVTPGCIFGGGGPPPNRTTPSGTISYFKNAVQRKDRAAEWGTLSPGLKQRMSRSAGRNIDLGDYIVARQALRQESQVRWAEDLIGLAGVGRARMQGPDRARVSIGALGQNADLGLVRLNRWELRVHGESQPYEGFAGDPNFRYERAADGSIHIIQQLDPGAAPTVDTFTPDQIQSFRETDWWYIDDLGGAEGQFLQ